jgi:hypothetical protein
VRWIAATALAALAVAGCGGTSASGTHYSADRVTRCLKQQDVSVRRWSGPTGSMLLDHADEAELIVNWPKGTPGSGSGTSSLQDDLLLRFDRDGDHARRHAETAPSFLRKPGEQQRDRAARQRRLRLGGQRVPPSGTSHAPAVRPVRPAVMKRLVLPARER